MPKKRSMAALLVAGVAALHRDCGRRLVFSRRKPPSARRGRTTFDSRAALLESLGRCEPGLSRRRSDRRTDHQPVAAAAAVSSSSRTTAFAYRGKAMDVKQIGKELGVRYVLEGSAQRSGTRVRVDAQLIDAVTGAHLGRISSTPMKPISSRCRTRSSPACAGMQVELTAAEASRVARAHPENPDAEELALQCRGRLSSARSRTERNAASLRAFANRPCGSITAMFARW